ncbi:MAG: NAD-dependent epimerase/dehydratase family protein, partial [Planctomycetota bacterium]|nr:NAD-dependent epimerase/dehydratase family protein [Planctomycetota bacterium]
QAGEPPVIYGDGSQTRDFVHVHDVARAFILAATRPDHPHGEMVNVAAGAPVRILDLARTITGLADRPGLIPSHEPARPGEAQHSHADVARAAELLGFRAAVSLEDGLAELVGQAVSS